MTRIRYSDRTEHMKAPFPWFGGKSRAGDLIWSRFGKVRNFVEPFAGSLATLLARPQPIEGPETVNDLDGLLVNFWRSVRFAPDAVAEAADWPVAELDLHARHMALVLARGTLTERLQADPEFFDPKLAGWWCWGACAWIGSGWCSGEGPWRRVETEDGLRLVNVNGHQPEAPALGDAGTGINRKLPHLGDAGTGINRKLPHLGDAGKGINRKLPHLGDAGKGEWLAALAERLRPVRIACGDWLRVMGPSVTTKHGLTAVLLDPPYNSDDAENDCYGVAHSNVADEVRQWAVENGNDPLLRIALCGYSDDHADLSGQGWSVDEWTARKGYQTDSGNSRRERIWFSPHCLGINRQSHLGI